MDVRRHRRWYQLVILPAQFDAVVPHLSLVEPSKRRRFDLEQDAFDVRPSSSSPRIVVFYQPQRRESGFGTEIPFPAVSQSRTDERPLSLKRGGGSGGVFVIGVIGGGAKPQDPQLCHSTGWKGASIWGDIHPPLKCPPLNNTGAGDGATLITVLLLGRCGGWKRGGVGTMVCLVLLWLWWF